MKKDPNPQSNVIKLIPRTWEPVVDGVFIYAPVTGKRRASTDSVAPVPGGTSEEHRAQFRVILGGRSR